MAKKKASKKGAAKKPAKKAAKAKAAKKAKPAKAAKKAAAKKPKPAKSAKPAKAAKPASPQLAIEFDDEGPTNVGANGNGHVDLGIEIIAMARTIYGNKPDAELLAFDPNDVDAFDPSIFYEMITERFGIQGDESNDYFSGFGGPIKNLIAFCTKRWDGKTNNAVEMPPADYLEEVVHEGD